MSARVPVIVGNWKMYKTVADGEQFIQALLPRVSDADGVEVGICPSFISLQPMVDSARGSRVQVYAQNMHQADEGAFTGEVSPPMLAEIGVHGVVLGHSERREHFAETDRALQLKVPKAMSVGLQPILCVGETEDERERGDTQRKLRHQVQEGLAKVETERLGEIVIAYEPIWAIGTGRWRRRPGAGRDRLHPRAGRGPLARAGRAHSRPVRGQRQARERRGGARAARRRWCPRGRREPRVPWRSRRSSPPAADGARPGSE